MNTKTMIAAISLAVVLLLGGCKQASSSSDEKVIKSEKSGDLTITISSATGVVRSGDNELTLSFTDAAGKLVDAGAVSLNFHMPAMGTMAEMNDKATLVTTDTPGKYRAKVNVEMGATWEAVVIYQGPSGSGQVRMNVNVK